MQFSSSLLENAVNEFAKLPGIGKKTALRLVLHLLKQENNDVTSLAKRLPGCGTRYDFVSVAIMWPMPISVPSAPTPCANRK